MSCKVSCHSDSSFCDLKWCVILNKRASAGVNKIHSGCSSPRLTRTDWTSGRRTGVCALVPPPNPSKKVLLQSTCTQQGQCKSPDFYCICWITVNHHCHPPSEKLAIYYRFCFFCCWRQQEIVGFLGKGCFRVTSFMFQRAYSVLLTLFLQWLWKNSLLCSALH